MPTNGRHAVSILVDGIPLEEYDVQQKGIARTCWIGSEAGKFNSEECTDHLAFDLYMDGTFVRGLIFYPKPFKQTKEARGSRADAQSINLFAFAQVSLTDDEAVAPIDQQCSDLGVIEVKIFRVLPDGVGQCDGVKDIQLGNKIVNERSKKMSTHQVTLQGAEACAINIVKLIDLDKDPIATFTFRYRPKDFLQAQGIAPCERNKQQAPPSSDEGSGSSSSSSELRGKKRKRDQRRSGSASDEEEEAAKQEIRSIQQQMADMQSRLNALQRRSGATVKTEVKRESTVSRSFSILADGVIDLTDD